VHADRHKNHRPRRTWDFLQSWSKFQRYLSLLAGVAALAVIIGLVILRNRPTSPPGEVASANGMSTSAAPAVSPSTASTRGAAQPGHGTKPRPPTNPAPPTSRATKLSGGLSIRVVGNHFVDGNGNTVRLLGANRSGTQYACAEGTGVFDGPSDDASIASMRKWGFTAVRVNGNEDCWLGINGVPERYSGASYRAAIGDYVRRINAAGMYVIFDLHHSAPGTTLATDQQPMPDRDHAPAYWRSVAEQFKNNNAVVFDLYNEPYPDDNHNTTAAWTCVRDGGTCPGVHFTAAGMQELVNAVRAAGATNPIMIGGPQYAGVVDRWLTYKPNDPAGQLAASIHVYYQSRANPEWSPCYLQQCWERTIAPLVRRVPVVMGEIGEHDCGHSLIDPLMSWNDRHGVSYLAWAWFTGDCADEPALISSYDGTPTAAGAGLRSHLLSLRR
jgi:endoglucanase